MHTEIAITKYTLIDLALAEAVVATAVPGVPAIGERVGGIVVEQIPLRPYILLRVGVLIKGEVLVGGGVVVQAGIVQK